MAEQLNEFLAKIQKEAVGKAEAEAAEKLAAAKAEAEKIVAEANTRAAAIVAEAEAKAKQFAENGEKTLKFAARDLLIYTRQELESLMRKIFAQQASQILKLDDVKAVALKILAAQDGPCTVEVPEGTDCAALQSYFMQQLAGKAAGAGVQVCPVKGLKAGLTVVCSGSDVKVELTDETLVELLSSQLTPKLAAALKD